jgi:GT2 family glycosyltransferase
MSGIPATVSVGTSIMKTFPSDRRSPVSSLILISHDAREQLLSSLDRLTIERMWTRVIVVDNGSNDGSSDAVRDRYPDVVLVQLGNEVDWTVAEKAGKAFAGEEYAIIWLNEVHEAVEVAEPELVAAA